MLLSPEAMVWMTACVGVGIVFLIKNCYKDYAQKIELDFIADYPEGTDEPIPLALTDEEAQDLINGCNDGSFGEMTNPNPPRVETQYFGFRRINPQPRARRVRLVRCNRHFGYMASRDGKYLIVVIHWRNWVKDRDNQVVDGDVFYAIKRFLNRERHPGSAETHSSQEN